MVPRRPAVGVVGAVVLLLLQGCTTLSPDEQRSADLLQRVTHQVATAYRVPPPALMIGRHPAGEGGSIRESGMITLSTTVLDSPFRYAILAHELAHYLLGHHADLVPTFQGLHEWEAWQRPRELDANAKAVEVLQRMNPGTGTVTERDALAHYYAYLLVVRRVGGWAPGHGAGCEEIADLLRRFPAHLSWARSLECSPLQ